MKNIIIQKNQNVLVKGVGKNKQAAFAEALSRVSKNLTKNNSQLIFKIEPKNFEINEFKEIKKKEHFLFFFFPRIVKSYEVELNVNVDVSYIPVDKLKTETVNVDDNDDLRLNLKGE